MELSIVMASMNEAKAIQSMITTIRQYTPVKTEIILVDSSIDGTDIIAETMGARVIKQTPQGHGMALKTGLNAAQGEIVITLDCDQTYPIDHIPFLVNQFKQKQYDLISACRLTPNLKKTMPFFNKLANTSFAFIVRVLYGIETHDVTTGMFLMRREVAHTAWKGNFSLPAEIIIRTCLSQKKYREIEIPYRERLGESTLAKWRSGKAYLRCFCHWKWGWFSCGEL